MTGLFFLAGCAALNPFLSEQERASRLIRKAKYMAPELFEEKRDTVIRTNVVTVPIEGDTFIFDFPLNDTTFSIVGNDGGKAEFTIISPRWEKVVGILHDTVTLTRDSLVTFIKTVYMKGKIITRTDTVTVACTDTVFVTRELASVLVKKKTYAWVWGLFAFLALAALIIALFAVGRKKLG